MLLQTYAGGGSHHPGGGGAFYDMFLHVLTTMLNKREVDELVAVERWKGHGDPYDRNMTFDPHVENCPM